MMKSIERLLKRPVALLLALVMVLSFMPIIHVHAQETTVSLGELIAEKYSGELSDAEKTILTSGALGTTVDLAYTYEAPPAEVDDEAELIVVTEAEKTVSVKTYKDSKGNTWIPVSFDIQVDSETVEGNDDLPLTDEDADGTYTGAYTYEDNMFSVVVTYALDVTVESASVEALLTAVEAIAEDVAYMNELRNGTCYSVTVQGQPVNLTVKGVLDNLVLDLSQMGVDVSALDGMTVDGKPVKSAVDVIYYLATEGIVYNDIPEGYDPIEIGFARTTNKNAAKELYRQQNEDGALELSAFLQEYAALSDLELLIAHGTELETVLDSTREDIGKVNGELEGIADELDENYKGEVLKGYRDDAAAAFVTVNEELAKHAQLLIQYGLPTEITEENLDEAIVAFEGAEALVYKKITEELTPYATLLESYGLSATVENRTQLDALASALEAKRVEAVGLINAALKQNETLLKANGITTTSVENAAQLQALIDQLDGKYNDAIADINKKLGDNKALLVANNIRTSVANAAELQEVVDGLKTVYNNAINGSDGINATLAQYETLLEQYELPTAVSNSADVQTLITGLENAKAEELGNLNEKLKEQEALFLANGWKEVPQVNTTADLKDLSDELKEKRDEALAALNTQLIAAGYLTEQTKLQDVAAAVKFRDEKLLGENGVYTSALAQASTLTGKTITSSADVTALITEAESAYSNVLAQVNSALAAANMDAVENSTQLGERITALKSSPYAALLADQIAQLESLQVQLAQAETAIESLKTARDSLAALETLIAAINTLETLEGYITQLDAAYELLTDVDTAVTSLGTAKTALETLESTIATATTAQSALATLEGVLAEDGQLKQGQKNLAVLELAVDKLAQAQNLLDTLATAVTNLKALQSALAQLDAAEEKLDEYVAMLNLLVGILQSVIDGTENAAQRFDDSAWNVLNDTALLNGTNYALVSEAARTYEGKTDLGLTDAVTLRVAEADVKYNMSMYNVTVNITAKYIKDNVETELETVSETYTLREGETAETIAEKIEALRETALAKWESTAVIDANYDCAEDVLDDLLTDGLLAGNITYDIAYTPKAYNLTFGEGYDEGTEPEAHPYGWTYTLPKHDTQDKAYSYVIIDTEGNEIRKNQGQTIEVTGDLTITRAVGDADQYKTVSDLLNNTGYGNLGTFLENNALQLDLEFWLVSPPADGKDLISIDGSQVTAQSVEAEVGSLVWKPVSATTYDMNGGAVETVSFTNGEATLNNTSFIQIRVTYELNLSAAELEAENIDVDEIVAQMNLQAVLAEDYKAQKAGLESLLSMRSQMRQIGKNYTMLGQAEYLSISEEAKQIVRDVVAQIKAVEAETGTPNLRLYTLLMQCDTDDDGVVDDMAAYYKNSNAIWAEIEFVKTLVDMVEADGENGALQGVLRENEYLDDFMDLKAVIDALNLPAPNAVIDREASDADMKELVNDIAAAAASETKWYTSADIDSMVWTAVSTTLNSSGGSGEGEIVPVQLTVKYGVGTKTVSGDILFQADKALDADDIAKLTAKVAELKQEYEIRYGALDEVHYKAVENLLKEGDVLEAGDTRELSVIWNAKVYTVMVEGMADQYITYAEPTFTLRGSYDADFSYVYTIGEATQNVSVLDQRYTITQDVFDSLFANGSLLVTRVVIDVAKNKLVSFANSIGAALIENNGAYSLVLPETGVTDFAMGIVMDTNYGVLSIGGKELKDANKQLHLQALIDAIMYSGFGTDTLIETVNSDGSINQLKLEGKQLTMNDVEADPSNLGGKLIQTTLGLNVVEGTAEKEIPLYITLTSAPAEMVQIRNTIAEQGYVKVVCEDGQMKVVANLPDYVYEAYLCALTMTDEADLRSIDDVGAKVALGYFIDMIDPILKADADLTTVENTLAKLGRNMTLSGRELLNVAGKSITTDTVYSAFTSRFDAKTMTYGDNSVTAPINNISINGLVDNQLQGMVDEMLKAQGMEAGTINLANLIYEYKTEGETEGGLNVNVSVAVEDIGTDYAALVVDVQAGAKNVLNLVTTAGELAAAVNSLAGYSYVVLLDDITADALSFSKTTILDLNGKTLTSAVNSTGNLIIVDGDFASTTVGTVDGTVSGNVKIMGGKYTANVSDFLTSNYEQVDGVVTGTLYNISESGDVITVTLNATNKNSEDENILTAANAKTLAVEIVTDLLLSYYPTAAMSIDGKTVFSVQADDLVAMLSGENRVDSAVDTALSWISASDLGDLVDTIVSDLTKFGNVAENLEAGKPIVSYDVSTSKWTLNAEHVADGNYITVNLGASDTATTKTLQIVVDGDLKDEVVNLLNALDKTTTVTSDFTVEDIARDAGDSDADGNTDDILLRASYEGTVVMDFRDDPAYVVMMAVVLADGCPAVKAAMVEGIEAYYEKSNLLPLESAFDALTVNQFCTALRNYARSDKLSTMIAGLGLSDTAKAGALADVDNTALGFDLAIDALGISIRKLDITGNASQTLGGLKQEAAEGNYYIITRDKIFDGERSTVRSYDLDYNVDVSKLEFQTYLFPVHVHKYDQMVATDDYKASDATCTAKATYYYSCTCGEKGTETFESGELKAHDFTKQDTSEKYLKEKATCTVKALYWYSCSVCGEASDTMTFYSGEYAPHTLTAHAAKDAECEKAGNSAYYSCSVCEKYFSDAEGTNEIEKDSWIIAATGHSLEKTEAKAPDCEKAGNSTYYTCSECGKYFSDVTGKNEIEKDSWVIAATGHTYDQEVVAEKYLKSAATYDSPAVYYKSCKCGAASTTETFTYGSALSDPTPAIGNPIVTADGVKVFGYKVDTAAKILYLDVQKSGITVEELASVLSANMVNDADGITGITAATTVNYQGRNVIPTGAVITLTAENSTGKASVDYAVVIMGDTNCNGRTDSADSYLIMRHYFGKKLTGYALLAADTNQNDRIESGDARKNQVKFTGSTAYVTALAK